MHNLIGIDPGFDRVGWAVGRSIHSQIQVMAYGCIITVAHTPYHQRLSAIQRELTAILMQYQPKAAGIESIFFTNNQKTAINVAQARGLLLAELLRQEVHIVELTPLQVKSRVTGDGHCTKQAMEKMVRLQCHLPNQKIIDDTIDAIGVLIAMQSSLTSP